MLIVGFDNSFLGLSCSLCLHATTHAAISTLMLLARRSSAEVGLRNIGRVGRIVHFDGSCCDFGRRINRDLLFGHGFGLDTIALVATLLGSAHLRSVSIRRSLCFIAHRCSGLLRNRQIRNFRLSFIGNWSNLGFRRCFLNSRNGFVRNSIRRKLSLSQSGSATSSARKFFLLGSLGCRC